MKKIIQKISVAFILVGGINLVASAQNATVDWGLGAQNINSVNDVNTAGALVNAYSLGPVGVTAVTVNGVDFEAFAFPGDYTETSVTLGNYNFTESAGALVSYNNLGSGAVPASTLDSSYLTLLSSAGSSDSPFTLTLTMGGLTDGENYLFQCWVNDSSQANSLNGTPFSTTATADNSVFINNNTSDANGGVGQFATGTFTATGTEETIDFNGVSFNDPLVNAFQLRDVTPTPEPSAYSLLGIGALAGVMKLRSRKLAAISS